MAAENSHHRILFGHLPHYYVTKRDDRLTRQDRRISTQGGSVRSVLGYIVVEELATGAAYVELLPHTTAECGPSLLLAVTYAWTADKHEPMLCPIGVPSTVWVEERILEEPDGYGEDFSEEASALRDICKALDVQLETYSESGSPFRPVRSRAYIETLMERAFGSVDGLMAHNSGFEQYRLSLARCCAVWLGLQADVQRCVYRNGTPEEFDDDLVLATRPLPAWWYDQAGARFKGDRRTEAAWKAFRPDYFWPPADSD